MTPLKTLLRKDNTLTKAAQNRVEAYLEQIGEERYYHFPSTLPCLGVFKTGDVVAGDVILWIEPAFEGKSRRGRWVRLVGYSAHVGEIARDSYGATGQHTLTFTDGRRRKGRVIHQSGCYLLRAADGREEKKEEKYRRGDKARDRALLEWLGRHADHHPSHDEKYRRAIERGLIPSPHG